MESGESSVHSSKKDLQILGSQGICGEASDLNLREVEESAAPGAGKGACEPVFSI